MVIFCWRRYQELGVAVRELPFDTADGVFCFGANIESKPRCLRAFFRFQIQRLWLPRFWRLRQRPMNFPKLDLGSCRWRFSKSAFLVDKHGACRQGVDDLTIAAELGQRNGAALVSSTYGDPANIQGDHHLDWLPSTGQAAWTLLTPFPTNIIQFGT